MNVSAKVSNYATMANKIVFLVLVKCVFSNWLPDSSNIHQTGVTSEVEQRLNALELKYGRELKSQTEEIAELKHQLAASKCGGIFCCFYLKRQKHDKSK